MWGNRLGWVISLVIVLAYGFVMGWLLRGAGTVSPPTEFARAEGRGARLHLPAGAQAGMPAMSDACDAAALYREAIALYRADRATYDAFAETGRPGTPEAAELAAVDRLVAAAGCAGMKVFADRPADVVRYGPPDDLHALRRLGDIAAVRLGLNYKRVNNAREATRYLQAAFALGAKLFEERLTYAEAELGLELMSKSAPALLDLAEQAQDAARLAELRQFEDFRKRLVTEDVQPMVGVLRSVDAAVVGRHAGDVFYFADHAPERMWRVEAIFALGRMRYFVGTDGRLGDQRGATERLQAYLNDADPIVRLAARAALDLTLEQYRMLG